MLRVFLPDAAPGGLDRLLARMPHSLRTPLGFDVPLADLMPEEVLSLCLRYGVTARATRIVIKQRPD